MDNITVCIHEGLAGVGVPGAANISRAVSGYQRWNYERLRSRGKGYKEVEGTDLVMQQPEM